ncbi:MAG: fasciclin domain-containing protein [Mycobacterium sp.]|nr:fasciclin domain-containing protein [Mycobacterium sp.]
MTTRIKTMGVAAAIAAIALSIPTAVTAYADDPTPVPVPVAKVPDPQGPGCDAYKSKYPTGSGSFASMATVPASQAIASNPDLSTFSAAISGQLNPEVNLIGVLDGGPYNVFAPTNDAFAKIDPAAFDALKANPAELTSVLFYHMALGFLGPDDIHGKLTSQQGAQLTVTGKGGDIKVDDTAKVVCGGIQAVGAKIYMIDTVLNPGDALPANATTTTSPTETSSTETTSTQTPAPGAPAPSAIETPAA